MPGSSGKRVETRRTKPRAMPTAKRPIADAAVDRILRDTVAKWRFKPFFEGGTVKRVCLVAVFNIRFD